ncbi:hypothetical protein [Nostoc sp. MS1]|uniref:hypothetical protein n=1 Tax=Nostoc sp. MS1 TaxID=2764711 RepID=UPI001CC67BCC|nr:hypothetical protein [Nostoc sp. MS1]
MPGTSKENGPAYRQSEAIAMIKTTEGIPVVLGHEGEKCVEAARTQGLASITWVGSSSDGESCTHWDKLRP